MLRPTCPTVLIRDQPKVSQTGRSFVIFFLISGISFIPILDFLYVLYILTSPSAQNIGRSQSA